MIHQAQLGLSDFEAEDMWQCVTCGACVERCPRGVAIIDIMRALRRSISSLGVAEVPEALRMTLKNISGTGNPMGEEAEKRPEWAAELGVKTFTPEMDVLYFSCCVPAYDTKVRRAATATARIMQKAGVNFGILEGAENCCGESVRKAGDESLYSRLAENNISVFKDNKVRKIVVTSPHCYHSFKNEYPDLDGKFEVVHFTEFLLELIKEGKIKPVKEVNKKVTYHDPCYLGRHNEIYDAPREVLKSIPGLELVEMTFSREDSLCCGGGGGRIWMETKKGERFSDFRIEQALEVGAEVMAVACPYCMSNFDDSLLTTGKEDSIAIKEVAELVAESLED
jgi:Fe-S oxidoreductase